MRPFTCASTILILASTCSHALAQPSFQRTIVVDPNGPPSADHTTIQAAIDAVPDNPSERWTISIYAGTYTVTSAIALAATEENIDLVGIDRDSVVIDMTGGGAAIEITSGPETKRNNAIRNLTIKTANGSGIRITKGLGINDKTPANITIENVTVEAGGAGAGNPGITGPISDLVQVVNCSVTTVDGIGLLVDDKWTIRDSTITAAGTDRDGISATTDGLGARIERCTVTTANGHGILAEDDWIISGCTIGATGANKDGVTTTDGRRVRIDNCTISTGSGHGILAEDDWVISNCTIKAAGGARRGIYGPNASRVQVANCNIATADGAGIFVDDNWSIRDTTVSAAGTDRDGIGGADGTNARIVNCGVTSAAGDGIMPSGNGWYIQGTRIEAKAAGKTGVNVVGKNDVTVRECDVVGGDTGVRVDNADNFQAFGSSFRGDVYGGLLNLGSDNAVFEDCSMLAGKVLMSTPPQTKGVWLTGTTTDRPSATFKGCRIMAEDASSGGLSPGVFGVDVDNANPARFIDCQITATNMTTSGGAPAYGVHTSVEPGSTGAILVGGVIKSSSGDEKEKEVYDLYRQFVNDVPKEAPLMSGTRLSKWFGGIKTAERPRPETQRTINADPASTTAVEATPINQGTTQCVENDAGHIENPDVYRVLSVTGETDQTGGDVWIIGTNWAGDMICDRITLEGKATKNGEKSFKTVTKICPDSGGTGSFTVGTTNEIGLTQPISDAADVLQQGRKLTAQSIFTIESMFGPVHPKRNTVEVAFNQGEQDTSFEWYYLATK